MRKHMLLVLLLSFYSIQAFSFTKLESYDSLMLLQSDNDQTLILQKCLDLTEIQQYYPKNEDGSFKQVHIMQFPFAFPGGIIVTKFNQPVLFGSRADIHSSNPDAFITFKSFSISGETATVVFDFLHNRNSASSNLVSVTINFQKSNGAWNIINSTLNTQKP